VFSSGGNRGLKRGCAAAEHFSVLGQRDTSCGSYVRAECIQLRPQLGLSCRQLFEVRKDARSRRRQSGKSPFKGNSSAL